MYVITSAPHNIECQICRDILILGAFLTSDKVGINQKFLGAKTPLKMISDIIRQIWHFAN